ncbi:MAG: KTSC domain-containing protein, partial [Candidatus Omnitrophica bacterium]|nr:KTSC domain-containing protein [Candidatus Omnitrophota bacterium]
MERKAIRSRDLAVVGYDSETQTLEIAFRSGGVYHYRGVPQDIYQALMSAPSHGRYFNDQIRNKY